MDERGGSLNADATKFAYNPRLADIGGTPYVMWREASGAGYQVRVKSWDGAAWTSVGGVLNVNPSRIAQLPSIASVAGTPYVAWEEYNGSFVEQVHVARWTGSAWSAVGGMLNVDPTKHAESVTIAGVGGTPFVTWQDESTAGKGQVYVARWTGSAWSAIGGALNPDGEGYSQSPRVAAVGGVPFVAWDDEDADGIRHARVVRLAVDVLDQHATATATGAALTATVDDFGVPLPVAFQYGSGGALGTQTATQVTSGAGAAAVTQTLDGLSPATHYSWRTVGLNPFGPSAPGATLGFTTPAVPAATIPAATPTPATTTTAPTTPAATTTPVVPTAHAATVACRAAKPSHRRVKVTCAVTLAAARSGPVRVELRRGAVVIARANARLNRGSVSVKLSARAPFRAGRYTLVVTAGKATIGRSPVQIAR